MAAKINLYNKTADFSKKNYEKTSFPDAKLRFCMNYCCTNFDSLSLQSQQSQSLRDKDEPAGYPS
jgi:hypothetical protein